MEAERRTPISALPARNTTLFLAIKTRFDYRKSIMLYTTNKQKHRNIYTPKGRLARRAEQSSVNLYKNQSQVQSEGGCLLSPVTRSHILNFQTIMNKARA